MDVLDNPGATSLHSMLQAVARGEMQAGVSCGNTGALMALARRELGSVPGISRPAISTAVPTRHAGRCYLLDLGASVEVHARHLVDFAHMGALMCRAVDDVARPRVALLNVGVEAGKGVARVREADAELRGRDTDTFDYIGYLEGDGIFSGAADVVVCDGFVGNAVLKASEGVAQMLLKRLQETFESHWSTRLVSALARPALMRFKAQLDPVRHNGASLLGLNQIVVKSHGNANDRAFAFAIDRAVREIAVGLPEHLRGAWSAVAATSAISSVDDVGRVDSGSRDTTGTDDSSLQGSAMTQSLALVFPGQGSQQQGMLRELAERYSVVRTTFDEASEALGYDLWHVVQEGPEEKLNATACTQPALLASSVAVWRVWQELEGPRPSMMAGHSLGEYSAMVCAGALGFAEGIRLVRLRGEAMQEAVPAGVGAMAAVLGLDDTAVEQACREAAGDEVVAAVNYNSPGRWSSPDIRGRWIVPSRCARRRVPSVRCRCRYRYPRTVR